MHLQALLFSLTALSSATFHLVAQNARSGDDIDDLADQTSFFVIGSGDDTHDNKCSNLINGNFSAPVSPVFTFPNAAQNSNGGLGLMQTNVFTLGAFCGLADGTQFVKDVDGAFRESMEGFALPSGQG